MTWIRVHSQATLVLALTALYGAVACVLAFHYGLYVDDSVARVANGYYVVFSRDPHLAAIGFIWPPVPSLLEIPFIIVLRPLGVPQFAGPILSVVFSAWNAAIIRAILREIGVDDRIGWALTLIYALNPFIVYYAANGMTEGPFLTSILLVSWAMLRWQRTGSAGMLMLGGLAGA